MTTETIIQKVRKEVGALDENGEQLLATIVKILQGGEDTATTQPSELIFTGRNITPEKYEALSREEKRRYIAGAEKLNKRWVENQLNSLQAKWIMVIDGQVVMHGATLNTYPEDEEFLALCERTGKFPFAFISPRVFDIEERPTAWHKTNEAYDAYPALTITIANNSPFTAINPARTFLLGRSVLLDLRPRLVLDFDARRTEVEVKKTAA